jgi:hypothetical protein
MVPPRFRSESYTCVTLAKKECDARIRMPFSIMPKRGGYVKSAE